MELELGGHLVSLEKGNLVGIYCPKRRRGKLILQERISLVVDGLRYDASPKNLVKTFSGGGTIETRWEVGGGYILTRRIHLSEVEHKPGVRILNIFEVSQEIRCRDTKPRELKICWTFWDRGASHKIVVEPPAPNYNPKKGLDHYREEYLCWRYRRRIPVLRLKDEYRKTISRGESVTSVNNNGWLHLYPPENTLLIVNRAVSDPGSPDYVVTLQKDLSLGGVDGNRFRVEMIYTPLETVGRDVVREGFLVGMGSWMGSMVVSTLPPSEKSLLHVYDATNRLGQYKYETPTPVLLIDPGKIPRIVELLEKLGELKTLWIVEPTDLEPTLELLDLIGEKIDVRIVGSVDNPLFESLAKFYHVDMVRSGELPLYFWRRRAECFPCGGFLFSAMVVCDHDPMVAAAASLLGRYLNAPVLTLDQDNTEEIQSLVSGCSPSFMVLVGRRAAKLRNDESKMVLFVDGDDKFDVVANLSDLFLKILFLDQILFLLRESCVEWWNNPERLGGWEPPRSYLEFFTRVGLRDVLAEILGFVENGRRVPEQLVWRLYRDTPLNLLLELFKHCLMETLVVVGHENFLCHELFHASRYSYLRRSPMLITPDINNNDKKDVLKHLNEIDDYINLLNNAIVEESRKKLLVELETLEKKFVHKKEHVLSGETGGSVKPLEEKVDLLVEKLGVKLSDMLHPAVRSRLEKNRALYLALFLSDHSIPWETLKLSKGYLGAINAVSRLSGVDEGDTSLLLCRYLFYENLPKRGKMRGLLVSNPFSDLVHDKKEEESIKRVAKNFGISLEKIFGEKATKKKVLDLLRDEHDIIHFVCHTSYDGCSIELFDGFLGGEELIKNGVGGYPLVFVNACGSARGAGGLSGLASTFLHGGAIGFLGSLWDVRDTHAAIFADVVYGCMLRRDTLGMALRKAKHVLLTRCGAQAGNGFIMFGDPVLRLLSSMGQDIVSVVTKLILDPRSGGIQVSMCFERFSGLVAPWPRFVVGKLFLGRGVKQLKLWDDEGELEHSFDVDKGFLSYVERVPSFPGSCYRFFLEYFVFCKEFSKSRDWVWCFGWDREAAKLGDAQYSWFVVRVGVVGGGVCRVVVEPSAVTMFEKGGWTCFGLGVWSDQMLFVRFLFGGGNNQH